MTKGGNPQILTDQSIGRGEGFLGSTGYPCLDGDRDSAAAEEKNMGGMWRAESAEYLDCAWFYAPLS